ncbi:hypothetical protein M9H77_26153 [Catharanthus roseus]|uniref:Uncharacterized protein n=1 Tax=Catharanthus roseus TaxID=4058 RepID=A0ACC0AAE2_CATRO|nr:hypothetical protein M9H77_26153 [Catharanthus roseus]
MTIRKPIKRRRTLDELPNGLKLTRVDRSITTQDVVKLSIECILARISVCRIIKKKMVDIQVLQLLYKQVQEAVIRILKENQEYNATHKQEIQDKREYLHDGVANDGVLLNFGEEQKNITHLYTRSRGRGRRTNARSLNRGRGRGKYNNGPAFGFGILKSKVLSTMTHVYTPDAIFQINKSDRPIQHGGRSRNILQRARTNFEFEPTSIGSSSSDCIRPNLQLLKENQLRAPPSNLQGNLKNMHVIRAVNGAGLTRTCAGLYPFIASKVKILYPRTHTLIDSIKWVWASIFDVLDHVRLYYPLQRSLGNMTQRRSYKLFIAHLDDHILASVLRGIV